MFNERNKSLKMFMVVCMLGMLSLFIIGCGGDDDVDAVLDEIPPTDMIVIGESGNLVDMNGTWKSNCIDDIDDGESETVSMTISGSKFTQIENQWWDDLTCPGTSDITIKVVGTVVLGDEVTVEKNGSDVTAIKIDGVFSSFEATCNSQDVADELNQDKTCGFENWAVGVPKDILGSTCQPDSDFKDVMYIDDTVNPDVWYGGDDEDLDVNGYPTELEEDTAKYRI